MENRLGLILLAADCGANDAEIAGRVVVGGSTIYHTKRRFVEGNLALALTEAPRAGAASKLALKEEARLIATACSNPPPGRDRGTLELLSDALVKLTDRKSQSRKTVRRRLAENDLKPWCKDMWCIPKVDAAYVAATENVLDLYAETPIHCEAPLLSLSKYEAGPLDTASGVHGLAETASPYRDRQPHQTDL